MPRTCRSAPVITTAPIPCSFRISAASQSVAVGLIVTTSLPLWDRIALTVMGILREHRRPLYRNLELCVGETAPREPFDNRRLPCPLIHPQKRLGGENRLPPSEIYAIFLNSVLKSPTSPNRLQKSMLIRYLQ